MPDPKPSFLHPELLAAWRSAKHIPPATGSASVVDVTSPSSGEKAA
jgi:hypothetical protein